MIGFSSFFCGVPPPPPIVEVGESIFGVFLTLVLPYVSAVIEFWCSLHDVGAYMPRWHRSIVPQNRLRAVCRQEIGEETPQTLF